MRARPGILAGLAASGALVALLGGVALGTGAGTAAGTGAGALAEVPTAFAGSSIPAGYLTWFQEAALTCPGLSWTVLAGIGHVESSDGTSTLPGVASGANFAGAEGPMQFEPGTFAEYATVGPGGVDPPSPYDPVDAIWSAAKMLCADGAAEPSGVAGAIFDYNHSAAYVSEVLAMADTYGTATGAALSGLAATVIADAEAYIGTPYVWGGEEPGVGFDCSGLVQWVFAEAGVSLPRVAQDQYDATPQLPPGAPLEPGDLVFFGTSTTDIEHVGIYIGGGEMVDAPHTGADVRIEPVPMFNPTFVAATRPEAATSAAS